MLINLLTSTEIWKSEVADISCCDVRTGCGECAVYVRNGKGSKSCTIPAEKLHSASLFYTSDWNVF
jgi:hypothetical protein